MKKISLILVLMISVSAFAQERKHKKAHQDRVEMTAEERASLKTQKMNSELDLTQDQQEEIKKLFTEQAKEREEYKAEKKEARTKNATARAKRSEGRNLRVEKREEHREKMKEILTEEQFATWTENMTKRERKAHNRENRNYRK
ncbi:Spy/CpxP family protein refolding chaperone [Salegentibacter sp.]|uniref:Spy/CpxP family protein refolding chaperone n=1 Tax=Salegentibacter sp. TaxID=1903072 RepID=UPI0035636637